MKHIRTFEQQNLEILNESLIETLFKFKDKIKDLFRTKIEELAPGKISEFTRAMEPYKDLSFDEIKAKVRAKAQELAVSESKVNEYGSEPRSDNYGRPSTSSYDEGLTLSGLIDGLLGGTIAGSILIFIANYAIVNWLHWGSGLSGKFLGITALTTVAAMMLFIAKGMLFNDED